MSRILQPRIFALAVVCASLTAQQRPDQRFAKTFPPELVLDRFIDVAQVAPKQFTVEMQNAEVRVLRAKLPGDMKIPLHDARSGVIVALTDVHLKIITPDKKSHELHVKAGQTHWIDGDTFSEQNISSSACEFLYVETMRPTGPIPYTPPY